jgi:hypothetical protein
MTAVPREPTSDECTSNAEIDGGRACWYPSMGGYVARAVAVPNSVKRSDDTCWSIYVWHDGDFPFGVDRSPRELHHCDPSDFIRFGRLIESFEE